MNQTTIHTQSHEAPPKRKVFISYHHRNDQTYKQALLKFNDTHGIFIDVSVDTGDIDVDLSNQAIRKKIRDDYMANSTVTILLVGTETKYRKHIDWELYSSMIDGSINKKSGVLVINLPSTNCSTFTAAHPNEKEIVHPDCTSWTSVKTRSEYERRYPYMPDRIIDNLLEPKAKISVVPWSKLTVERLAFLIEATFQARDKCEYDMSRDMRRSDFNPNS
ncbi:TIR domain-containing protein [Acidithiobacillus sp. HP-11]|uniref:TIR domain-containing protein n=1 Tax=Acidithiobacillus sp. HP-11 TaxID=2697656 RepID=UPI001D0D60A8|nr:TIR domain-containing protein [Acidithiobacillus sp. HP-11]